MSRLASAMVQLGRTSTGFGVMRSIARDMISSIARGEPAARGTSTAVSGGAMSTHPVHYHVEPAPRFTRLQLLIRAIAFCALGVVGVSFGGVLVFSYFALVVFAATRVSAHGAARYLDEDGPRIAHLLRWLAAICAWTGLVVDRLPSAHADEAVHHEIETNAHPTASHCTVGAANPWRDPLAQQPLWTKSSGCALHGKQHSVERYCAGDVGGERRSVSSIYNAIPSQH